MKSIKYLILIIPLYLFLALPVFAQGNGSGGAEPTMYGGDREEKMEARKEAMEAKKEAAEEKKAEMQEAREEKMAERCEKMQERAQERHERLQEKVDFHAEKYAELIARLEDVASKLAEKYPDFNLDALNAKIGELSDMVDAYVAAYGTFLATVEEIADEASDTCGDGEGEQYRERLQAARDELKAAIGERQAIRSFYAHDIREEIKNLREQAREMMMENREKSVEETSVDEESVETSVKSEE